MTIHQRAAPLVRREAAEPHTKQTRPQHSQLVWLRPNAGFGAGSAYAVPMPEAYYEFNPDWDFNQQLHRELRDAPTVQIPDITPCMLDCGDPQCREWSDVFTLPGNSRAEAMSNLIAGKYSGAEYHVSDCEMTFDRPR